MRKLLLLLSGVVLTASAHVHPKGFSIEPAAGWRAQDNDSGVLLIPAGAVANEEVYIAALQDGYSAAEEAKTVRELSQTFLQNGGQIRRAGEREAIGNGAAYYWEIVEPRTRAVAGLKIYFVPVGTRAEVIVAYGMANRVAARDGELRQMLATMRVAAPAGNSSALADQWTRKLQGKMIRQFHAYSGMSSDKRHMLNADGSYWFRSNSMVSIDVPGASASSTGGNGVQGRWRISEANGNVFLLVQLTNGETRQYRITQDARNWYLNGEKAFAVDPE